MRRIFGIFACLLIAGTVLGQQDGNREDGLRLNDSVAIFTKVGDDSAYTARDLNFQGNIRTGGFAQMDTIVGTTIHISGNTTVAGNFTVASGNNVSASNGEFIITPSGQVRATSLAFNDAATITELYTIHMFRQNGTVNADANAGKLYAQDAASSSEVFAMDEAGNATQLTAHNKDGDWVHYSYNVKTHEVEYVNMTKLIRALERLLQEKFYHKQRLSSVPKGDHRLWMEERAGDAPKGAYLRHMRELAAEKEKQK